MFSASSPSPWGEEVTMEIMNLLVNPGKGPALSHTTHGSPLMPRGLCGAELKAGQDMAPEPATNTTSQS